MARKKKTKKTAQRSTARTGSAKNNAAKTRAGEKQTAKKTARKAGTRKTSRGLPGSRNARGTRTERSASGDRGPNALAVALAFEPKGMGLRAAGQAGALQGLSDLETASSESVEELIEEGNAFEAGVVKGVEDAPDADTGPIKPREVVGDDIPEEYLDRDDR